MGASRIGKRMRRRWAKPSARVRGDEWLLSDILKTSGSMFANDVREPSASKKSRIKAQPAVSQPIGYRHFFRCKGRATTKRISWEIDDSMLFRSDAFEAYERQVCRARARAKENSRYTFLDASYPESGVWRVNTQSERIPSAWVLRASPKSFWFERSRARAEAPTMPAAPGVSLPAVALKTIATNGASICFSRRCCLQPRRRSSFLLLTNCLPEPWSPRPSPHHVRIVQVCVIN
jgi:hypothetical protein